MSAKESIAIVGMGCRFPGAKNLEEFWELLRDGKDAITEIPADRFDVDAIYDPVPRSMGKLVTRWGGFLENLDQFDPYFFGISPREACCMDPQQRLLLEVAWEALEDAGLPFEKLHGSDAGVFIGMSTNDYEDLAFKDRDNVDLYMMTGCSRGVASGRLSYFLDLQGPSMTIDAACASSLVAVHLACQSLWRQECTLALAGGANLILEPEQGLGFSKMGLLSPDGRCKTFDASADGFVRSEGVGVVVLKPLSQALADRDPIYCTIRGSAVNNDGRTSGLLVTPGRKAQEDVLRKANLDAGVSPELIQYVEAHGTGTLVGDNVEVSAIGAVYGQHRSPDNPCLIGSVKTNIGHSEGAAGIAGLIKVALSLKHGFIPANLHLHEVHPDLPLERLHLRIPQKLEKWSATDHSVFAGVSCFGISATNAHVILEQVSWPVAIPLSASTEGDKAQLLTLSAQNPEALVALARAYFEDITYKSAADVSSLADICYTASCRRTHHDQRLALLAHSKHELSEQVGAFLENGDLQGIKSGSVSRKTPKIVYVFSGQGSQWLGMGRALLQQEPVFLATIRECDEIIRRYVDWSLLTVLASKEDLFSGSIDVLQPTLLSMELALAALWTSWGIKPDAVVGHSMGELAAAAVSGALSLEDALCAICYRSLLLRRVSGKGSMAVIELPFDAAEQLLVGYEDSVSIAACNSPTATVLSGDTATIEVMIEMLQERGVYCSLIKVNVASHCAQVEPLLDDLQRGLSKLRPQDTSIPFYSTVIGAPIAGSELNANYWGRNLRQPVLFFPTVEQLLQDEYTVFLEVTPHPILIGPLREALRSRPYSGTFLPSLRRDMDERSVLLESLSHLYTLGVTVDWHQLYSATEKFVQVPGYPWQRERFWLSEPDVNYDHAEKRSLTVPRQKNSNEHPILGPVFTSAARPDEFVWEFDLACQLFPYLSDHRIQGQAIVPATAYLELVLAAAKVVFGEYTSSLENIVFKKALFLPDDGVQHVQLVIAPEMPGIVSFHFFSLPHDKNQWHSPWEQHVHGTIHLQRETQLPPASAPDFVDDMQTQSLHITDGMQHYQNMQKHDLQYGSNFQGVDQIWRRSGEAFCHVKVVDGIQDDIEDYLFHPALFDACLQAVLIALPQSVMDNGVHQGPIVPVRIERLRLYQHVHTDLWSHAQLHMKQAEEGDLFTLSWKIVDMTGQVVLEASGVCVQYLHLDSNKGHPEENIHDWLYEIRWEEANTGFNKSAGFNDHTVMNKKGTWLVFADRHGTSQQLIDALQEAGDAVITVYAGDHYQAWTDTSRYQINPSQPDNFAQLFEAIYGSDKLSCRGILHLWSLDESATEDISLSMLDDAELLGCGSTLSIIQAMQHISWKQVPRLWLITNGVQDIGQGSTTVSVAQAPLWGLGRVIVYEHPELRCARVDLSTQIAQNEVQSLFEAIVHDDQEDQIALRGEQRYVARLVKVASEVLPEPTPISSFEQSNAFLATGQPFRIEIPLTGSLDNLQLCTTIRQKPGLGEVEIQVDMVGLNFKDVLYALGMLDYDSAENNFGHECAGRILRLGEDVEGFKIGDEVITTNPLSCFRRYVVKDASQVIKKPTHLSIVEAATTPIVFLTAYYALCHVGRLAAGERVLIHAASGGVGLAAVQIAQQIGAEIFATAGTPEKRDFLHSLGIRHVLDSRSVAFADEIMQITDGQGVDVVLNSLAGEALTKSFLLLAHHGRFLELGKRDIHLNHQLSLAPFEQSITFAAIDISLLLRERPKLMMKLLREIMEQFEERKLHPLPTTLFPLAKTIDAFRFLAQAKHIGKVALSFEEIKRQQTELRVKNDLFTDQSTYLITGGLGGLGLTIVQWMVAQGARHFVLIGRGEASATAMETLNALRYGNVEVMVFQADVTQKQQVARVLTEIKAVMPPLRGIIHAAAVLRDGILLQTSYERLRAVMAPKINGAWNLHTLTKDIPLDFFVLFSSTASLIGLPGQGNYSAANAFLDALAHQRRREGLPGLSINWGAWTDIGLAAAQSNRGERLALRGIKNLTPPQGLDMFKLLLDSTKAQVGAMPFDVAQWQQFYPSVRFSAMFNTLLTQAGKDVMPGKDAQKEKQKVTLDALLAYDLDKREQVVQTLLSEHMARILKLPIAKLNIMRPIHTLGIDSLMAVELKNQIEIDLYVTVPVVLLLQNTTTAQLATFLINELEKRASAKNTFSYSNADD